jgi:NAD(P)-dependent dehydrogenase (short-subunit alcohol dehydrogenase family)
VLITGATGSLGSAISREFAQTEARLALASTSADKLDQLADELALPEKRVLTFSGDLTNPQDVQALVERVKSRFGHLNVLLNTVGGWSGGTPVWETEVEAWEKALVLNLRSAFLLSRAVLPPMLEDGWGRIVHVGSKTAVEPRAKQAGYAVSKMGLITLTEVIAKEVKGRGVTANVVLPSIIDTPANRRAMPKLDPEKWVKPAQIAATMRFLCSNEAAAINGARIPIYGAL